MLESSRSCISNRRPRRFFPRPRGPRTSSRPVGLGYGRAVAIGLIAVLIVTIGVYPQPVLGAIQAAAQHFVAVGA